MEFLTYPKFNEQILLVPHPISLERIMTTKAALFVFFTIYSAFTVCENHETRFFIECRHMNDYAETKFRPADF